MSQELDLMGWTQPGCFKVSQVSGESSPKSWIILADYLFQIQLIGFYRTFLPFVYWLGLVELNIT